MAAASDRHGHVRGQHPCLRDAHGGRDHRRRRRCRHDCRRLPHRPARRKRAGSADGLCGGRRGHRRFHLGHGGATGNRLDRTGARDSGLPVLARSRAGDQPADGRARARTRQRSGSRLPHGAGLPRAGYARHHRRRAGVDRECAIRRPCCDGRAVQLGHRGGA